MKHRFPFSANAPKQTRFNKPFIIIQKIATIKLEKYMIV